MTRNFSKISAALLAALTISAAAISTADTASARMMGGMGRHMGHGGHMGRMAHMGHGRMGHMGRGMGFGRGMAFGVGVGVVGALVAANVAQNVIYAESYDPGTGVRVRSVKVGNDHVVTTNDGKGKPKRVVKKGKEPASASATNTETGETTSVVDNQNGSRTISKTDKTGKTTDKWIEQNKNPDSASSFDPESGITTLR